MSFPARGLCTVVSSVATMLGPPGPCLHPLTKGREFKTAFNKSQQTTNIHKSGVIMDTK